MLPRKKYIDVGIKGLELDEDTLVEVLEEFEEVLRKTIVSRTRRRLRTLEVLVKARYSSEEGLTVEVEVEAWGRPIPPLSYDELVAEALSEAGDWLERRLRALGREKSRGHSGTNS